MTEKKATAQSKTTSLLQDTMSEHEFVMRKIRAQCQEVMDAATMCSKLGSTRILELGPPKVRVSDKFLEELNILLGYVECLAAFGYTKSIDYRKLPELRMQYTNDLTNIVKQAREDNRVTGPTYIKTAEDMLNESRHETSPFK